MDAPPGKVRRVSRELLVVENAGGLLVQAACMRIEDFEIPDISLLAYLLGEVEPDGLLDKFRTAGYELPPFGRSP